MNIKQLIQNTKDALAKDDTDDIKKASEELSAKVMELSSRVYQEQNAESASAAENASDDEDKKDNVKDAEFEEK